jgi:hypothetical protein
LKYLLGQIQPDGGNQFHGMARFHVVVTTTTLWHTDAVIAGPFHTSKRAGQVGPRISLCQAQGSGDKTQLTDSAIPKQISFISSPASALQRAGLLQL